MKKMSKYIKESFKISLLALVVSVIGLKSNAQDPHFSQYFSSPLTINPSFTGKEVADMRLAINTRSQWWGGSGINPYNTATFSFEKRLATNRLGEDQLAIGFLGLTDGSNNGILKKNYFGTSIAYNKLISSQTTLGLGLSMVYANRILDANQFQFQSQFGSMGFQRSIPSNDYISVEKNSYLDFNAGVNLSQDLDNWGYTVGAGYFHAGRPNEGAYNSKQYAIDTRLSLQGNAWFGIGKGNHRSTFHVSTLSEFQGVNKIFTLGGIYKAKIAGDDTIESLNFGAFNRFGDAVYPYVGLEATNWLLSLT
jgi:type IX secretion system PorP/SprF family membrane protein